MYDQSAIADTFTTLADEMRLTGAFLLLQTDDGEGFTLSYGSTQLGGDAEPTADTAIRIGSVTKTWTTTVILQLVQEGKLSLDDPISRYRPDVPNGDNITIEMLLRMRSGLYNYTFDPGMNEIMDAEPDHVFDPEELLAVAFEHEPVFAPGAEYQYCNTNTVLLGRVAEQIENAPLAELISDRVLDPAGASRSLLPAADDADIPAPFAHGYAIGTNAETVDGPLVLDDAELAQLDAGELVPIDRTFDNPSWAWAAGAGISTADDLAALAVALTDGTFLDEPMQAQRLDSVLPQKPASPPNVPKYGYGIVDFSGSFGHTGELPGYNTFAGRDPESGITLVVWANFAPSATGLDPATVMAKEIVTDVNG